MTPSRPRTLVHHGEDGDRRSPPILRVGVGAAVVGLGFLCPGVAGASHGDGGAPQTAPNPDNDNQDKEEINLTQAGDLAANNLGLQLERTDITVTDGDNDIHIHDGPYDNPAWDGVTICTRLATFNSSAITSGCSSIRLAETRPLIPMRRSLTGSTWVATRVGTPAGLGIGQRRARTPTRIPTRA